MSMSFHVKGVRDLDGKFAKVIAVKVACDAAGLAYPVELKDYCKAPNSTYSLASESVEHITREMEEMDVSQAVIESKEDGSDFFEVDLSKLSPEVKKIRFIVGY